MPLPKLYLPPADASNLDVLNSVLPVEMETLALDPEALTKTLPIVSYAPITLVAALFLCERQNTHSEIGTERALAQTN